MIDRKQQALEGEAYREYEREMRILVMSEREVVESHFG